MTLDEAIARCDALKPNQYSPDEKIQWLSTLDGMIWHEILAVHEAAEGETLPAAFAGYTGETDRATVLLAAEPYSDLYPKYLAAQIDFCNAEFGRFNNSAALFNSVYDDYSRWYNRTHAPLQNNSVRL